MLLLMLYIIVKMMFVWMFIDLSLQHSKSIEKLYVERPKDFKRKIKLTKIFRKGWVTLSWCNILDSTVILMIVIYF